MDETTPPRTEPIATMSEDEAWDFLAAQNVGRLATAAAGTVDIFPVNYALDGRAILLRTTPGSKLVELVVNSAVAFETDTWDETEAASVVLKGRAYILESDDDLARSEARRLETFTVTEKDTWVRIQPTEVEGRRFARPSGEE